METNFEVGDIVISISGHDKNHLFIIVGIDKNGYLAIIDGKYHKRNNSKTKNPKHLRKVAHDDGILKKVHSCVSTEAEIYKMIKVYKDKE